MAFDLTDEELKATKEMNGTAWKEEKKKANTDTTYCINTTCNKCWRHISNWKFDNDKNYWYTSGLDDCEV